MTKKMSSMIEFSQEDLLLLQQIDESELGDFHESDLAYLNDLYT